MEAGDLSQLDGRTIVALLRAAVRADRFCEGALLGFFESAAMRRWLVRLRKIDDGTAKGATMSDAEWRGRPTLRDCIYGQAVGDALGVPYEFKARGNFKCTDMVGYGSHHQPAGTWSDDTDTTAAVAGGLAGIVYGPGAIPAEWLDGLRGKDVIESCLF